jgi:4-diphosphocytidyl-2-C-methyl-D-erythritol kinase
VTGAAPVRAGDALVVEAPAKVNLTLHVVGRRADGYHLLDSLVAFVACGDTLTLCPAPALSLEVDGPMAAALAAEGDNIVLRAARALADFAGMPPNVAIRLTKRLPVASGIGGGSSDAAAALRALRALWGLEIADGELARLGLSLGADVPVCVRARPAAMSGVGEVLAAAPALPECWLALVNPGVPLATPAVFKARTGGFSQAMPLTEAPADARALAAELAKRGNDLEAAAMSLAPGIAVALDDLRAAPGCLLARMSGSGATCFGLFASAAEAEGAARAVAARRPGWWAASGHLMR